MAQTLQFKVPDISCAGCANAVKSALGELPGVLDVQVDVDSKTVNVSHSEASSRTDMVGALTEAGYPPAA
ncbi:MAG: heavy-metal-associated domain-containing protein [Armatimonadetes bacterium]|nr:heavy-metal-associated domain-containing protein [Armatimonadota bacterium]